MKRVVISVVVAGAMLTGLFLNQTLSEKTAMADTPAAKSGAMLAHMVYFSLNEPTDANKQKLIDACHKYLSDADGLVFFAAGTCATDYAREVNDRDFDVALQTVFKDRATHDAYQVAPKHKEFINECKSMWKKVRVFDADVTGK